MGHQDPASLWAFANGELDAVKTASVEAHLEKCDACKAALDEVRATASLLRPADVPPLSDSAWRRIDEAVIEHAAEELARPKSFLEVIASYLPALPAPAFVLAGLAMVAVGGYYYLSTPAESSVHETPAVMAEKTSPAVTMPAPEPKPGVEAPKFVEGPRLASVVAAKRAHLINAKSTALAKGAELQRGSRLKTDSGGDAWLKLPDGSKAGVLAKADVSFVALAPTDIRIELDQGAIVVAAAKHHPREFAVESHGVEVRVVGTRFLVEREGSETKVAVEEGAVEVSSPSGVNRVAAGSRLAIRDDGGLVAERKLTRDDNVKFKSLTAEEPRETASRSKPVAMVAPVRDVSGTPPIPTPAPTPVALPSSVAPSEAVASAPVSNERPAVEGSADEPDSVSVGSAAPPVVQQAPVQQPALASPPPPPPTPPVATYAPPAAPVPPPPRPPTAAGVYVQGGSQAMCSRFAYTRARAENIYQKRIMRAPWRDNGKIEEIWVHFRCLQIDQNFPEAAKEEALLNQLLYYQRLGYVIH